VNVCRLDCENVLGQNCRSDKEGTLFGGVVS